MKYENIDRVNTITKQIKKDEKELEILTSYMDGDLIRVNISHNGATIQTIVVGDSEHKYTKNAIRFIEDCIQDCRDRITSSILELEKL